MKPPYIAALAVATLAFGPTACSFDFHRADGGPVVDVGVPIDAVGETVDASVDAGQPTDAPTDTVPRPDECSGDCHQHASCETTDEGPACRCKPGYTGDGKKGCFTYEQVILVDNPVVYFRFEETGTEAEAVDSSSNGYSGTYNSPPDLDVSGVLDVPSTAAGFDGVDDVLKVEHRQPLRLNGAFTVEFWAREVTHSNANPGLFRKGPSETKDGYLVYIGSTSQLGFKRQGVEVISTGKISSVWHYFALVNDGTQAQWFFDGKPDQSPPQSSTFDESLGVDSLMIGQGDKATAIELDELAFYDSALTATQIARHYEAARRPPP